MGRNIFRYALMLSMGAFCLVWLGSCKKTDDPDPCKNYIPLSANFTIEQELYRKQNGSLDGLIKGEVHHRVRIGGYSVFLTANQDMDEYEWRIGTDARVWKTKTVEISFGRANQNINITLIGKRKRNSICNPNEKETDTIRRTIITVDYDQMPLWGKYKGIWTNNPNDSLTITFLARHPIHDELSPYLYNLPKGCRTMGYNSYFIPEYALLEGNVVDSSWIYRLFPKREYGRTKCEISLLLDNKKLNVGFWHGDSIDPTPRIKKQFIGKKID